MGRKEFYEKLEELNLVRTKVAAQVKRLEIIDAPRLKRLKQIEKETLHLKLLHENAM